MPRSQTGRQVKWQRSAKKVTSGRPAAAPRAYASRKGLNTAPWICEFCVKCLTTKGPPHQFWWRRSTCICTHVDHFFSTLPTEKNAKNSWFLVPKEHTRLKGSDNCSNSCPLGEQSPWPSFRNTACWIPALLAGLFGATEGWDERWHAGTSVANVTKVVAPWGMRGAQRIGENERNTRVYQAENGHFI